MRLGEARRAGVGILLEVGVATAVVVSDAIVAGPNLRQVGIALFVAWMVGRSRWSCPPGPAQLLPMVGRIWIPTFHVLLALALVGLLMSVGMRGLRLGMMLCIFLVGSGIATLGASRGGDGSGRILVVGDRVFSDAIVAELAQRGNRDYVVIGCCDPEALAPTADIWDEGVDLLLLAPGASRIDVFRRLERRILESDVRVLELSGFYEAVFGYVPLGSINAAWFQCIMHPRHRRGISAGKRIIDVVIALGLLVPVGLVVLVSAPLIRLDGGPVFYSQTRVGECNKHFRIWKLRTMTGGPAGNEQSWSSAGDQRVTRIGRILRRTHLDETPQIWNVLRGEMSLVGPRPEQPAIAQALDAQIGFYSRRHLTRPGITGWSQVLNGYSGSVDGARVKAAFDLFYVRHESVHLDLLILLETLRTFVADKQWQVPNRESLALFPFSAETHSSTADLPSARRASAPESAA